ncbi:MAG: hypothetical protein IIB00_11085 [candidate division Zixibacteria bacterium]|nr:hypothetical protein [candidate division Zixibacteria bacterium]
MRTDMMKIKAKLLTAVIIASLLCLAIAQAEPNLTIPNSKFDFGFAPQNSKLTHVFWLKSTGTDSLFIDKIVPG